MRNTKSESNERMDAPVELEVAFAQKEAEKRRYNNAYAQTWQQEMSLHDGRPSRPLWKSRKVRRGNHRHYPDHNKAPEFIIASSLRRRASRFASFCA